MTSPLSPVTALQMIVEGCGRRPYDEAGSETLRGLGLTTIVLVGRSLPAAS